MMKPSLATLALIALHIAVAGRSEAAPPDGDEAGMVVVRSALGAWVLKQDPAHPGQNCAVRFIAAKKNGAGMILVGPGSGAVAAAIVLQAPNLQPPATVEQAQVELVQSGLPPARMRGQRLGGAPGTGGMLAIPVGDLRQTMASMRDSERGMVVRIDGAEAMTLDYDGLNQARDAMLGCLDGKRLAGTTVREATAQIRPLGRSTIVGNAYFKAAVLAKKQYPPKGSPAVGLIWMTDEFKAWHERIKREKKPPERIPESVLRSFLSTTILDDAGGFRFDNLPAGEYVLVANFSYKENVSRQEVIGRTDVYAGNRYIGSNDHIASWSYDIRKATSFGKNVTIARDGETVRVTLDKSQLFCFFVCL